MNVSHLRNEFKAFDFRILIKPGIVLAVIAFSAMFGYRANMQTTVMVAMAVGGFIGAIVLMRNLEWGLVAAIVSSQLIRWELGTGTKVPINATVVIIMALLGIWILNMLVLEREIRLVPARVTLAAVAFIVGVTISLVAAGIPFVPLATESASFSAQFGGWALYAFSAGLFLLVGHRVRDVIWLRRLVWVYLAASGLYMLARLLPNLNILLYRLFVPGSSFGSMFWIWVIALAFGQAVFNTDLTPRWRLLLLGLVLLTFYVTWSQTSEWISGWLPPLLAVGILIWFRSWRWAVIFGVLGVIFLFFTQSSFVSQILNPTQIYSAESRAATWPIMYQLIKASPLLGLGPSNYYHYTVLYPILGWYEKFNSHNNYIDIIAQTGLVGLVLFLWFSTEIGLLGWRLRDRVSDGFSRAFVYSALAGLAATLVSGLLGDWFMPFVYNIGFAGFRASSMGWLFLGGLLALYRFNLEKEEA